MTLSKEFIANIIPRLPDLDEPTGNEVFSIRFPLAIEDRLMGVSGQKKTALLRQIVVRAIAEMPDWVDAIERELDELAKKKG